MCVWLIFRIRFFFRKTGWRGNYMDHREGRGRNRDRADRQEEDRHNTWELRRVHPETILPLSPSARSVPKSSLTEVFAP